MEVLFAAVGAGIAGLALLLQSKSPLPSEADYNKALEKLKTSPEDSDANTIAGKYVAFVLGDYDQGMTYLAKSGDKTLRTLAEHERAPLYADTAPKKVGMGDEWVAAAKSYPALFRIFYDRAGQWYAAAWPNLDAAWRDKLHDRAKKLAASRPQGPGRSALPTGWENWAGTPGQRPAVVDGSIAHSGSYSIKMIPADEKVRGSYSHLRSLPTPISGKTAEFSGYFLADGTEDRNDQYRIIFLDQAGQVVGGAQGPYLEPDKPFWTRMNGKVDVPDGAVKAFLSLVLYSKKGNLWVDDVSMKIDGREILKNTSFEDK